MINIFILVLLHNIYHHKILLSHIIVLDNVVFIYELLFGTNDPNSIIICCSMQTIIKNTKHHNVNHDSLVIFLVWRISGQ